MSLFWVRLEPPASRTTSKGGELRERFDAEHGGNVIERLHTIKPAAKRRVGLGFTGLATYRPDAVVGSVLSTQPAPRLQLPDANRRLALDKLPVPVLASLRWPGRPELPGGNAAWTFMVQHPFGDFALFIGEVPREEARGLRPFEVWVNGAEQPRGLGALALRATRHAAGGQGRRHAGDRRADQP